MKTPPPVRRRRLALVAAGALLLSACNPAASQANTTISPIQSGGSAPLAGGTVSPPSTTVEVVPGSSADNPAPVNNSKFATEVKVDGSTGAVTPLGIATIPKLEGVDKAGECLALFATNTGLRASEVVVPLEAYATSMLLTEGEPLDPDADAACDRSKLDAAGWGRRKDAELLPGADYNTVSLFFLPDGQTVQGIRLYDKEDETVETFYEPAVLKSPPALPDQREGASPLGLVEPDPDGTTPQVFGDEYEEFEMSITGAVTTVSRTDGKPGTCVAVVGQLTPTRSIGAVMNSLGVPPVTLIAEGRAHAQNADSCAQSTLTSAGWLNLRQAGVTNGNRFGFAATFAVDNENPLLQAIVTGDLFGGPSERGMHTPNIIDEIPDAPRRGTTNPRLPLRPVALEVGTPAVDNDVPSSVPPMNPPQTSVATGAAPVSTAATPTATSVSGSAGFRASSVKSPPLEASPTTPSSTSTSTTSTVPATDAAPDATTAAPATEPPVVSGDPTITIGMEATWHGDVYGIVGLPSNAANATCYAVLMTWFVSDGNPTDPPPVGLISSGAYWAPSETEATCDPEALTDAGWQDSTAANFNDVNQAPMHVFVPIFVPHTDDTFGAIGVGNVADDVNVGYVEPLRLTAPPQIPGL